MARYCHPLCQEPPGQNVHEVEVPEKLAELDGQELLRKLSEEDSVKQVLSTVVTAGQSK